MTGDPNPLASAEVPARSFTDQMGFTLELARPPTRIVSLVPSQTELLFDLGLADRVVGVTRYCLHPKHARTTAEVIGGTKRFDLSKIAALHPDLIIGNKEENYEQGIDSLRASFPIWMSDIFSLNDALEMIDAIGSITDTTDRSDALTGSISASWQALPRLDRTSTLYLIWKKPYMGVGADTFIDDVLRRLGFTNSLADRDRYPVLELTEIREMRPRVLMLSSEPFPFVQEHVAELAAELPGTKVLLVDGEMFSWYGSRLRHSPAYFAPLLESITEQTAAVSNP